MIMNPVDAVMLGILQGATEFLPVSSSGHLILAEYFLGLKDVSIVFDVTLHMGTLLAVLYYFREDWKAMAASLVNQRDVRLLFLLILGTIPGAIFGFFLEDIVSTVLRSPWVVVSTLSGVALLLFAAERMSRQNRTFERIGVRDALVVGCAQALAVVPGVSRSGITMTAALFLGMERQAAAKFSFLLSAPIIAGAGFYEGLKLFRHGFSGLDASYLWGFLAACISGYLAIAFLMKFLVRHTFYPFVSYRLVLAGIVAILLAGGGVQ